VCDVLGERGGEPVAAVRDPFDDYGNLSTADRKFLGEFIRQHHPRMAHEFAMFGVPSSDSDAIEVYGNSKSGFRSDEKYIAGLIARSHGMPVRDCAQRLRQLYRVPSYRSIHAVYLMALLRIGDYLQVEEPRAPRVVFQYRSLPSRVSDLEHRTHQSVDDLNWDDDDPDDWDGDDDEW